MTKIDHKPASSLHESRHDSPRTRDQWTETSLQLCARAMARRGPNAPPSNRQAHRSSHGIAGPSPEANRSRTMTAYYPWIPTGVADPLQMIFATLVQRAAEQHGGTADWYDEEPDHLTDAVDTGGSEPAHAVNEDGWSAIEAELPAILRKINRRQALRKRLDQLARVHVETVEAEQPQANAEEEEVEGAPEPEDRRRYRVPTTPLTHRTSGSMRIGRLKMMDPFPMEKTPTAEYLAAQICHPDGTRTDTVLPIVPEEVCND